MYNFHPLVFLCTFPQFQSYRISQVRRCRVIFIDSIFVEDDQIPLDCLVACVVGVNGLPSALAQAQLWLVVEQQT